MPPVDQVELAPLVGRQGPQKWMIQDFRPGAELALAIVQARPHLLKLGRETSPNLIQRHSSRRGALRCVASAWDISDMHNQQSRHAVSQFGRRGQRSAAVKAFRYAAICVLVGKEKMLQYLGRTPLSSRRLPQRPGTGPRCRIFYFPPQTFEIGIHGIG